MTTAVALLAPPAAPPAHLGVYRAVFTGPLFRLTRAVEEADVVAVAPAGCLVPGLAARLRAAVGRGCRVVASGPAVGSLAATGVLDGRRVAVRDGQQPFFARRFPRVRVAAGVRFVDDDPVLTAADSRGGLELCLHLVRKDHGAAAAADLSAGLHPLFVQRSCTRRH
ncbi:hypothetical protein Asp14428_02360 [Actinoplanes sp. NBRC 14428]|uniref:DJ-1/PfpI family protein n=1 Tax=Pseudosporangium ferrugineum TaxID=439699 RepID=A0A2T0SIJ6_9ACTN|nr:hypothetical protein [Pseudosporangium ferrugineum]PRY33244.1 hypothetical protein CLV70_101406 [Pseudosporangium ferrugineum]BCJ48761.1 hypothetical protein Asp14428_02360 [Actinoplanes sp. NBRC 14428]